MKKTFTTLSLCFLFIFNGFAQCDLDNASFETWNLEPGQVEAGDGTIFSNDILLPEGNSSLIRFLFIAFELFFDPAFGTVLETDPQGFAGIDRSTDASDGDFAVQLRGGYGINFGDLYSPKSCTEIADSFAFDVKHMGDTEDTLNVFIVFDEGLAPLPQTESDLLNLPAYAIGEYFYNSDSAYHRISLPIIENFEADVDTFYYLIIGTTADSSYFLIDNLSFGEEDDDDPVVSCSFEDYPSFSLSQTNDVCLCDEFSLFDAEGVFFADFIDQDTVPPLFIVVDANDDIQYISEVAQDSFFFNEFCPEDPDEDLFLVQILYESEDSISQIFEIDNLSELTTCHAQSEKLLINTIFDTAVIQMLENGILLDDNEEVIICNIDDIVQEFTFTSNSDLVSTIFVFASSGILVDQFEVDQTTTFDLPPGEYLVGMTTSLSSFPNFEGQTVETTLELISCWWGSDNFYNVIILEVNEPGCISSTIDQELLSNINILENPVSEILHLQVNQTITKSVQINIVDMNGKIHLSRSLISLENDLAIDVADYPQGSYVFQIVSDDGIASYKFVKM